ncbi:MAG: low molecular weight phosphotyrosine protein phosphatase [Paludibacteraceae bacterium]|nr:low molecular weight phosphotyrosine protein phosphatase [Paludibacteraceae bacterium]
MRRLLFICHGNICRSPMAEYVMKHLVAEQGTSAEWEIASAAVSSEEIGNDMYPPAKRKLNEKNIPFAPRAARKITFDDYLYYDYIICMDRSNIRLLQRIIVDDSLGKVSLLMHWTGEERDVADPWYTGDFEATYRDVLAGCKAILKFI